MYVFVSCVTNILIIIIVITIVNIIIIALDLRFNLKRTGTSDGNQEKEVGIADGNPGNWIVLVILQVMLRHLYQEPATFIYLLSFHLYIFYVKRENCV